MTTSGKMRIYELSKDLGKINFISGPKGAGKTSIIEALEKTFTKPHTNFHNNFIHMHRTLQNSTKL
jgi:AAA15 family ATPase/GTPase